MMKLEVNGPNFWWMEIHSSPRQSRWLQDNQTDVDETVKTIVKLVEGDADSFAQRAEDYYQKRPLVLKQVENLYRAYRSLADHYDQLVGNVRHNLPKALQTQYGLLCDSPRGSPLAKQLPLFRKSSSLSPRPREFDSSVDHNRCNNAVSGYDDHAFGDLVQQQNCNAKSKLCWDEHESSLSSSDLDREYSSPENENSEHSPGHVKDHNDVSTKEDKRIVEDFQEVGNSKSVEEKISCGNELSYSVDFCQNLETRFASLDTEGKDVESEFTFDNVADSGRKMKHLQDDCVKMVENDRFKLDQLQRFQERIEQLEARKTELEDEVKILAQQKGSTETSVKILTAELSALLQHNQKLQSELSDSVNQKKRCEIDFNEKDAEISQLNRRLHQLNAEVAASHATLRSLQNYISTQKARIAELSEEKREAIRQLCFTIDVMKDRRRRLEEAVILLSKQAQGPVSLCSRGGWKAMFAQSWARFSRHPRSLASEP